MGTLGRFANIAGVPTPSDYISTLSLAAGVAEEITFPPGAAFVSFGAASDFFVRWDGEAATIPTTDILDGNASEANPTARMIRGRTMCSVISAEDQLVTLSFWGES